MNAPPITVEATLHADGVTFPTMLEVLDRIHRDQQQRGRPPMTEEQMTAELAQREADDEEYDERWRQIWAQARPTPGQSDIP